MPEDVVLNTAQPGMIVHGNSVSLGTRCHHTYMHHGKTTTDGNTSLSRSCNDFLAFIAFNTNNTAINGIIESRLYPVPEVLVSVLSTFRHSMLQALRE